MHCVKFLTLKHSISAVDAKMEGLEVTFLFQFGNLRDMVSAPVSSITLKTLKDMACDFINAKVSPRTICFVIHAIVTIL